MVVNNYISSFLSVSIKATFDLTISMRGQRATGKILRNNYHHRNCRPSSTGKTSSGRMEMPKIV